MIQIILGGTCGLQTFGFTPLSLDLIAFNVSHVSNRVVLLNWETAKENGVKIFEIEYSIEGSSWSKTGEVSAGGNYDFNNYHFTHYNAKAGLNLYRLKMIGIDGKFTYSNVKSIVIKNDEGKGNVYPNPFSAKLTLEYSNTSGVNNATIQVVDIAGKPLEQTNWNMTEGVNNKILDLYKCSAQEEYTSWSSEIIMAEPFYFMKK